MAKTSEDDLVHEGRKAFQLCVDSEEDNRRTALDDIKFARLSEQWPDKIAKQREAEGRPCLTINKLPAFIRQVVNDARQNKPSIHVHPVDSGADKKTADIMSGLIRNIEYTSNADVAYDTAVECAVTGGVGYLRVGLDYSYDDSFDMDICIKRVSNPFSVYGDPNSRLADSSDWDVAFVTDSMSLAAFKREYPDAEKVDFDDDAWSGSDMEPWRDGESVIIAEWWTREKVDEEVFQFLDVRTGKPVTFLASQIQSDEDIAALVQAGQLQYQRSRKGKTCKVTQRIMNGLEVLKETEWLGKYIPIVPVYGDEFDVEGKRYFRSLVHNAIDAQRMFNYWRTASTELIALAPKVPFIGPEGAFDADIEGWNTANTKSHAFLQYSKAKGGEWVPPQRQPLDTGPAAGAIQEALNASDDIKAIVGMYDASLGQKSNETSGKAILARQQEGDVSTFHFIDNMARAIRHTGRILIDLIPKVYNAPRIIRVIGEDGTETAQAINQQTQETDKKGNPVTDEMGQAIEAMHDLTAGKYDLTVKTGPSFTTRREEAAMQMTELIRVSPPQAVPILGKYLIKNLDFPNADDIAEDLEKMMSGQLPPEVEKAIEEGKKKMAQQEEEIKNLRLDQSANIAKVNADRETAREQAMIDWAEMEKKVESEERMALIQIASKERIAMAELAAEERIDRIRAQNEARNADAKVAVAAHTAEQNAKIKAKAAEKPRANA